MDRSRSPRPLTRAALAACVVAAGVPAPAFALAPPAGDTIPADPVAERPDAANVPMRFFNAPWSKVLRDVAEASGSTLVMTDVPPGRFSRFDRNAYTRGEAVRFLNRELEPAGFRVLEEGPNLVVVHERSVRQRYRRPVAPDAAGRRLSPPDHHREPVPTPAKRERKFGSLRPARDLSVAPAGHERDGDRFDRPAFAREGFGGRRVTTADLNADAETPTAVLTPAGDVRAAADALAAADAAPIKTVTVRVGRERAKLVARTLLNAVKPHAKLVNSGPGGLPAFEAYRPDPAADAPTFVGAPAFTVGVDESRDELVVTAPGARAGRVAAALRRIDAAGDGARQKVIVGTPATARIARQITPIVARLAAARQEGPQPPAPNQPPRPDRPNLPQPEPGDAEQGQNPPRDRAELESIIENLRADVQIEEFGDSNVLILRGNKEDLDAVQKVIERLEALSAGLQPQIQLFLLKHVDAVPLAALLTQVYEELERVRNRGEESPSRVTVLPVGKPNGIVVIASETDFEAVERLALQLDQPVPAGTQLEVFTLENAIASQVAAAIEAFYADREGLFPQVRVFADIRTNQVIVNAAPNGLAEVAKLIDDLDRGVSGLVSNVEIVDLDFATAELLAQTINAAVQQILDPSQAQQGLGGGGGGGGGAGGGQEAEALSVARSVIVEYVTATGEVGRSGLLADVSVAADATGNRLILTAPPKTMPFLVALVAALDAPSGARADVKAFTLQNADAEAAVEALRELFVGEATPGADGAAAGVTLAGTADAGSALVPLRFSFDSRTQTVFAIGGTDALSLVEAVLLRLDDENRDKKQFFTVKLVNTPADQVATSLAALLDARRTLLGEVPGILSPVELIERDVVVIPEVFSNRLLIFAADGSRDEILRLVRQIDEAPPQVAIQALLVEVSLDNTDEFGVELGLQDSTLFGRANLGGDASPFAFNTTDPLPQGVLNPSALATQGLSNLGLGRANADLGVGGFVFSASSENISVLLRALAAKQQVHVLSRPQVTVLDQQEARIQVGQNVPILTGVTVSGLTTTPNITYAQAGLILAVTPRVSPDGTVFMQVAAENSNFILSGTPLFTDPGTGSTVNSPVQNISSTNTVVSVPNGQTVVIGGIITESETVTERGVPYVKDIPYLGQLFRTDTTVKGRNELLVFLTPRIIYTDADFELIKQVESDRMHYLEHEAEAIHGPLFGVPPEPGAGGYEPAMFGAPDGLGPSAGFAPPAPVPGGGPVPGGVPTGPFLPGPFPGDGTPVPAAPAPADPFGAPAPR